MQAKQARQSDRRFELNAYKTRKFVHADLSD